MLMRAVKVSRAREAKSSAMMSPPRGYNNKRVSGREKFWLIWSERSVAEMEEIKHRVNPKDKGLVSAPVKFYSQLNPMPSARIHQALYAIFSVLRSSGGSPQRVGG